MGKLWAGRTKGNLDDITDDFNSSIRFDKRLYKQDITGSVAHTKMLAKQGIISNLEAEMIINGLNKIFDDIESGKLKFDMNAEDIHTFIEQVLTERIGDVGKKLHTARSRNDQVALDLRLYLRDEINEINKLISDLIFIIINQAERNKVAIMPGYTHLQRAQPVTMGHYLMTYAMMFLRDINRLKDCRNRMDESPIGSCALAGTPHNIDRLFEAKKLGFFDVMKNSLDGVSDRDFCIEFLAAMSILMMHMSRLSEELILWSSWEFKFIELSDNFTTGSSIMPQKKNPDMCELIRGKTGRIYGDLIAFLTMMKSLPLAYNKDMQEDKEIIFDACDTAKICVKIMGLVIKSMKVLCDNIKQAAQTGFINATDLADYLVKKGLAFRDAYEISGKIVARCIAENKVLETLELDIYKSFCDLISDDVYLAVDLRNCLEMRKSYGGPSVKSIDEQINYIKQALKYYKNG